MAESGDTGGPTRAIVKRSPKARRASTPTRATRRSAGHSAGDPGSQTARRALSAQATAGNRAVGQMLAGEEGHFGRRAARAAVRGATPGRFPFGDRIAAETGGRINPHTVPSVVVDQMPGLGVSFGGKIALRRGSGINIARHELAHALGGNEWVADRASRDPRVLGRLAQRGGRPVDGWAVGFEFQTTGPNNPTLMVPEDDDWKVAPKASYGSNEPMYQGPTYKIEQDHHDIEVIVEPPVSETRTGRERLIEIMNAVVLHMAAIQAGGTGKGGLYTNLDELRRQGKDPDKTVSVLTKLPERGYTRARKTYQKALRLQHEKEESKGLETSTKDPMLAKLKSRMEAAKSLLHKTRELQMRRMLKWGVKVKTDPFEAHPQATMGVRYEKVTEMLERLSTRAYDKKKDDPSRGIGWGDFSLYKGLGRQATKAAITAVRKALGKLADDPAYGRLQGLLTQLSMYFHVGQKVRGKLSHVKDLAPFMARIDLIPWVKALSTAEFKVLETMVKTEDPRLPVAFGVEGRSSLSSMKMAPRGAKGSEQKVANLSPLDVLRGLLSSSPTDLIGKNVSEGLHIFGPEKGDSLGKMSDYGDIGRGVDGDRFASGTVAEFRRIKHRVPYTGWKAIALAVFDTTVLVNEGPEALAKVRGDTKKKKTVKKVSSLESPVSMLAPMPTSAPMPKSSSEIDKVSSSGIVKAPIPKAPIPKSSSEIGKVSSSGIVKAPIPMAPMSSELGKTSSKSSGVAPPAPERSKVVPLGVEALRDRFRPYFLNPFDLQLAITAMNRIPVSRGRVETAGVAHVGKVFAAAAGHSMDLHRLARSLKSNGHLWQYLAQKANNPEQLDEATRPMLTGQDWNRSVTPSTVLFDAYLEDLVDSTAFLSQAEGQTLARRWNAFAMVFNRQRLSSNNCYVDPYTRRRYREVQETLADGHCLIHGLNIIVRGENANPDRVREARRTIADHIQLQDLRQQLTDMVWQYVDTGYVQGLGARSRAVLEADSSVEQARQHTLLVQQSSWLEELSPKDEVSTKGKEPLKGKESLKGKLDESSKSPVKSSSPSVLVKQDVSDLTLGGYGVITPALSYGASTAPGDRSGVLVYVNNSHYIVLEPIEELVEVGVPEVPESVSKESPPKKSVSKESPPKKSAPKQSPPKKTVSKSVGKGSEKSHKKLRKSKKTAPPMVGRLKRVVANRDVFGEATRRQVERIVRVHMPRSVFRDRDERGAFLAEWTAKVLKEQKTLVAAAEQERFGGTQTRKLIERVRKAIILEYPI